MNFDWTFAVELRREENGSVGAYNAAMPEAIASGDDESRALAEMAHAIDAAIRGKIHFGMDLEPPSVPSDPPPGLHWLTVSPALAAKASLYVLWRRSGLSKVALAERLAVNEKEARRILDPDHPTGLDRLAEAVAIFGHRLTVRAVAA